MISVLASSPARGGHSTKRAPECALLPRPSLGSTVASLGRSAGASVLRAGVALGMLALGLPSQAAAQQSGESWTIAAGASRISVAAVHSAGYAALPISALQALGAEVASTPGGIRVRGSGIDLHLFPGSPFFSAGGELRQLVQPVYEDGGSVYVPVQLVVDHLPSLLGDRLAVDLAARAVRNGGPGSAGSGQAAPPSAAPVPRARSAPQPASAQASAARPAPAASAPTARRLVVIDAGHGGVDPGAQGPSGIREKDVALAVARRVAAILREDPAFEVRMTRERDTLIALTDRTRMANRWRKDGQDALFMSIHTNAHDQRSVRGFETFFLSEAKTEDARRVAEMENAAQRYENPAQKLDPLSFIFHDLRQNKYLRDSSAWAAMIQDRLATVHPGPNRGVKQAGFVVLNGAFMPAVLVELGFISHPAEERMLASADYQGRMARQLADAVKDFFRQSPAPTMAR
jgi:N-acetylmuramoyl-L-alanine amidase